MKLFHWNRLETCKNYATGDAVVMAADIEEARARLREGLEAWARENREWVYECGDDEDRAELAAKIEADVALEPHLVTDAPHAVVIRGGE